MYKEILKEAKKQIPEAEPSILLRLGAIPTLALKFKDYISDIPIHPGDLDNPKEFVMGFKPVYNA